MSGLSAAPLLALRAVGARGAVGAPSRQGYHLVKDAPPPAGVSSTRESAIYQMVGRSLVGAIPLHTHFAFLSMDCPEWRRSIAAACDMHFLACVRSRSRCPIPLVPASRTDLQIDLMECSFFSVHTRNDSRGLGGKAVHPIRSATDLFRCDSGSG